MDSGNSVQSHTKTSSATPVQKGKKGQQSGRDLVTVSYASKSSPSTSSASSTIHSVSIHAVPSENVKPSSRPNVITSMQAPISTAATSLKELTISSICSPQSTVIQTVKSTGLVSAAEISDSIARPDAVSVIQKASQEPQSASNENITFKTPSPLRPSRTVKTTSGSIKPSVSVSVVKDNTQYVPSVKIASFAKPQPLLKTGSVTKIKDDLTRTSPSKLVPKSAAPSSVSVSFPQQKSVVSRSVPTEGVSHKPTQASATALADVANGNSSDEEEILVYVQFDTQLDSDLLEPHTPFNIIGVDSQKPVLQLGDQMFEGKWHDTIGTALFFEGDSSNALVGDPVFTNIPEQPLKYHSKTSKTLHMSRIFIKSKEPETLDSEDILDQTENENDDLINSTEPEEILPDVDEDFVVGIEEPFPILPEMD